MLDVAIQSEGSLYRADMSSEPEELPIPVPKAKQVQETVRAAIQKERSGSASILPKSGSILPKRKAPDTPEV